MQGDQRDEMEGTEGRTAELKHGDMGQGSDALTNSAGHTVAESVEPAPLAGEGPGSEVIGESTTTASPWSGGIGESTTTAMTSVPQPLPTGSSDLSGEKDTLKDSIQITTLLLSGQRKTFTFSKESTILEVKQYVLDHWPPEWGGGAADRYPSGVDGIKLIWRGRILDNVLRLEDAGFRVQTNTIVHMPIQTIQDAAELEAECLKKGGKRSSGRHVYMPGSRPTGANDDDAGQRSAGCCRCLVM